MTATLTPLRGKLEAEMSVRSQDIGFIDRGQKVTLKLDAYDFLRHGSAQGVITSVSEGSFTEDADGRPTAPFFKVRVRIDETKLTNVPADFRLIPGMTATIEIRIGSRRVVTYFLYPLFRMLDESIREP